MSFGPKKYDLTECDREPIHKLGFIQGFGALLAMTSDWLVAYHSANAGEVLSLKGDIEVGQPIKSVLCEAAIKTIRDTLKDLNHDDSVERVFGLELTAGGAKFDCAIHCTGSLTVIEFEPHDPTSYAPHLDQLRPMISEIEGADSVEELCKRGATIVKRLLGFDRVMLYRFASDGSGEVAAEAKEPQFESFLGLHYPRTDVPEQARELYLRNRFRIISDINETPVPILPEITFGDETLDLSMSTLRAVSPIHIEYLQNMGVGASLSISIVHQGKLWGLFACHHYGPRILPFSQRTVAELFSQMFSLTLDRALLDGANRLRLLGREIHDQLMVRLAGGEALVDSLPLIDEVLERAIPHDGSSVFAEGIYRSRGSAPNEAEFRAILPAINAAPTSKVIATDSLAAQLKSARPFVDRAAGALIFPISRAPRDYLVLWRKELRQTVTWAGNPEKAVARENDADRLTPRKSFEAWEETVSGQSAEWTEEERGIAESLRVTLLEVILRLTDMAVQERSRAQEQQELLIAELNHRVRNILNLIRSLVAQSQHEAKDILDYSDIIGGRIRALASAHDNITRKNWSPAPISSLIEAEVEAYLQEKMDRLQISGDDVLIVPEAYTVLALVMHEMVTNSAKYGSLCDRRGTLAIDLTRDKDGDLRIAWRESGGPEVREPTRRGFGSTIIERSIPFELKGEAQVRYERSGLEADFLIPARYIGTATEEDEPFEPDTKAPASRPASGAAGQVPERVLVVEDSMIIALDTQECLKLLGVPHVETVGSVAAALDAISAARPDFAIVDYNLGNETSDRVLEKLRELGVSHVLATGYGEKPIDGSDDTMLGVITKPYGKAEIERALSNLG
ncbi:HWE histidine kinase domain-containing protein [Altererythrobacter arenosus]|uniref:histidine kinase n=1 Tax=Altererythrobacter arenosus TaxID=3032592 RepID=A0ABY8FXX8_9SPHN|nr:HWE histidine kinase domain-containing protein [Altererythrobacter sp. CAU 1644]WFL78256.1 HWE histidine kinase domain-containing protein [Altererythrobacter sp. CAU 1644]